MLRALRWSLVAAWLGVGVLTGLALSDPFSRWVLLLVPAGLASGWLLWTFGAGREMAAGLIGLSVWSLVSGSRSQHPPCQVGGEFAACEPGPAWPWVVAAALLVVVGLSIMTGAVGRTRGPIARTR